MVNMALCVTLSKQLCRHSNPRHAALAEVLRVAVKDLAGLKDRVTVFELLLQTPAVTQTKTLSVAVKPFAFAGRSPAPLTFIVPVQLATPPAPATT